MASSKDVFIVGPGFIGWNVVDLLLKENYKVTGYVRRTEHAAGLEKSGATTVLGDLDDTAKITLHALEYPIIFHTATADHLPSVQAILEAIKQRAAAGKPTLFIHTSGTSVLSDSSKSAFKSSQLYHDNQRSEIDSVPNDNPHRAIDLAIVSAQKELGTNAKLAIMIPPLIYGYNPAHTRLTIQIPTLTRFALKHGYAGYVGAGEAVESNIHVYDLARAYIVLLHHMERSDPAALLENPYYFCENTGDAEPTWKEVAAEIGKGLYAANRIEDPVPRSIPDELHSDLFGEFTYAVIGLNSRSRAVRLRELGWEPVEKDVFRSFHEDELPVILSESIDGTFSGYAGTVAS